MGNSFDFIKKQSAIMNQQAEQIRALKAQLSDQALGLAILEAVEKIHNGEEPSDFELSFPTVDWVWRMNRVYNALA